MGLFFYILIFSVRIRSEILDKINDLSDDTGRTRNELIVMLLEFALAHSEVVSEK